MYLNCIHIHYVHVHGEESSLISFRSTVSLSFKIFVLSLCRCYRLESLLQKHVILDETMAWLSTLGGAYSSLGDYFHTHVSYYFTQVCVMLLSHLYISPAYHSRIQEIFDMRRSEVYFVQAWYVFEWNFTFMSTAYQGVCAMYVWCMKHICDISMVDPLHSILICRVCVV